MQIRAAGGLIGNKNEERGGRRGAGGADEFTDDVFFGHAAGAETRPKVAEESVESGAIQRAVDLTHLQEPPKTRRKSGEPFPIAVVAHDEDERLMAGFKQRADHLRIAQVSPPQQLLVRDPGQFDGLDDVVREMVIETALQPQVFVRREVRESAL